MFSICERVLVIVLSVLLLGSITWSGLYFFETNFVTPTYSAETIGAHSGGTAAITITKKWDSPLTIQQSVVSDLAGYSCSQDGKEVLERGVTQGMTNITGGGVTAVNARYAYLLDLTAMSVSADTLRPFDCRLTLANGASAEFTATPMDK